MMFWIFDDVDLVSVDGCFLRDSVSSLSGSPVLELVVRHSRFPF
jgi:hypothetical protein